MKSLFFKQEKPLTVKILGGFIALLAILSLIDSNAGSVQIGVMITLSVLLLSYSISFEIREDFKNSKHIKLFGFSVLKTKLSIIYPDYITIFSAFYKQETNWGSVSALGKEARKATFVIRFFKKNKHFTVYKSNKLSLVRSQALELSRLLKVDLENY